MLTWHAARRVPSVCRTTWPVSRCSSHPRSWVLVGLVRFATVVITADPTPGNMLRLIRQYAAKRSFIVPTVLRAVVDDLRARDEVPPRMHGI